MPLITKLLSTTSVALSVMLVGFYPSSVWSEDERPKELVPGLDMWSEMRKPAPYWSSKETEPDLLPRLERHREFMKAGAPVEYRGGKNPYPQARMIIDDGGRLYEKHCATCHGAKGAGNGKAGEDLRPPPAFLRYLIRRPRSVDEYLQWTISEGGEQFSSDMPSFKEDLTDLQIWQIVTYMRADFPDVGNIDEN